MQTRKRYVHWLSFDSAHTTRVLATLDAGTGFEIARAYVGHGARYVLRVESAAPYESLDLDVNSGSSPLRRHAHKPSGLGPGLPWNRLREILTDRA